jgi:hydrogenase nickel incorporation protein HypA/HybF
MHEYSLMQTLLAQIREIARENRARNVTEITVAVGPLSGVEPLLLEGAFSQLAIGELLASARLRIELVPLIIECEACRQTSELTDFVFACPLCGCEQTRVTNGDTFILRNVVLEQPQALEMTS